MYFNFLLITLVGCSGPLVSALFAIDARKTIKDLIQTTHLIIKAYEMFFYNAHVCSEFKCCCQHIMCRGTRLDDIYMCMGVYVMCV